MRCMSLHRPVSPRRGALQAPDVALVLLTGQPALAIVRSWQTFTYISSWTCTGLTNSSAVADVRACIVVNGRYAPAVAVAGNRTSASIDIKADSTGVQLIKNRASLAKTNCDQISLGGYLTRACFGETMSGSCDDYVRSDIHVAYARSTVPQWSYAVGKSPTKRYCT